MNGYLLELRAKDEQIKQQAKSLEELKEEIRRKSQYSSYLRSCALSGESDPQNYDEFCSYMNYNNSAKDGANG